LSSVEVALFSTAFPSYSASARQVPVVRVRMKDSALLALSFGTDIGYIGDKIGFVVVFY